MISLCAMAIVESSFFKNLNFIAAVHIVHRWCISCVSRPNVIEFEGIYFVIKINISITLVISLLQFRMRTRCLYKLNQFDYNKFRVIV